MMYAIQSIFFIEVDNSLGIASTAVAVAARLKHSAQLYIVGEGCCPSSNFFCIYPGSYFSNYIIIC